MQVRAFERDNRESGLSPEQSCCRNDRADIMYENTRTAIGCVTIREGDILALMSEPEDLPHFDGLRRFP